MPDETPHRMPNIPDQPSCLDRSLLWTWIAALMGVAGFMFLFARPVFGFWPQLAAMVSVFIVLAFRADGRRLCNELSAARLKSAATLAGGLAAAAVLYGVFWLGDFLAARIFSFAPGDVSRIYDLRGAMPPGLIVLLLILIGSGEEIFWRGFLQRRFAAHCGLRGVLLVASLYGAAHLTSGNRMLILSALVAGLFWGLLYRLKGSLWINVISHVAWDIAVFIVWPIR